ncbi:hypothetical protein [Roseomonas sp. WA12]
MLNHAFVGVGYARHVMIAISVFLNRLRKATEAYRLGTLEIRKYVASLHNHEQLDAHARSLSHFETCVLETCLSAAALNAVSNFLGASPLFSNGDGSAFDRVRCITNRIKHFEDDIQDAARKRQTVPLAPMWVVQDGIECAACSVTFKELATLLTGMAEDAEELSEKRPAAFAQSRRQELAERNPPLKPS